MLVEKEVGESKANDMSTHPGLSEPVIAHGAGALVF